MVKAWKPEKEAVEKDQVGQRGHHGGLARHVSEKGLTSSEILNSW